MGVQTAFDFGQAAPPQPVAPAEHAANPLEAPGNPGGVVGACGPAQALPPPARAQPDSAPSSRPAAPDDMSEPAGEGGEDGDGGPSPSRLWSRGRLEAALQVATGMPLSLLLTDNGRTMMSCRREGEQMKVRLHHMFQHADATVVEAVAGYLTKTAPEAGLVLGRFIEAHRERIRRREPRRVFLRPAGEHHDLQAIFHQLNHRYFDGQVQARITWSRRSKPRGQGAAATRRSIKLGSYASRDQLIRVHPVLDADWVPSYFVAFIVYHEMLHQVVPPERTGTRRGFHGADFRARERRFEHYARALAWEQKYLRKLLRA